jgi:hypothetical protein
MLNIPAKMYVQLEKPVIVSTYTYILFFQLNRLKRGVANKKQIQLIDKPEIS